MKIQKLHLLEDSAYTDWYISNCLQCNIADLENSFVCITDKLVNAKHSLINVVSENSNAYNDLLLKVNQNYFSTVFINFLNYAKAVFTNKITATTPTFVWIVWSGDLYSLKAFNFKIYDAYSQKKLDERSKLSLKQYIGRLKLKYIDKIDFTTKKEDKQEEIYKAIKKINVGATCMSQEVRFIEETLKLKIKHLPFTMISIKNEVNVQSSTHKHSILVGNSADPSNNHFEILKTLHKHRVKDEIIIPLSYGDMTYSSKLKKDSVKFKLKITTLDTLLSKEEYYSVLATVKVAVFGHNIQKAFGNIIALLFFGAKVFLKEKNPVYYELTKLGVKIYSLEKEFTPENISSPLDSSIASKNTEILENTFSQPMILKYYGHLLSQ